MALSRRNFLKSGALTTAAFTSLAGLSACGGRRRPEGYINQVEGFGELVADRNGLFDLPRGFSYEVITEAGQPMDDGMVVPGDPDGMAAFAGEDDTIVLIMNHELHENEPEKAGFAHLNEDSADILETLNAFDRTDAGIPHPGGTTTLILDASSLEIRRHFLSLAGTVNNCAGGPTPWGSWISCEETLLKAGENAQFDHGYAFEVPSSADGLVEPVALRGMGRFNREAVAVDPVTGIVYQTEDDRPALFTRFIPDHPGELWRSGQLQALAVRDRPGLNTNNWPDNPDRVEVGETLLVEWLDVDSIDNPNNDMAVRMMASGAAGFTRGEGIWFGDGEVFFCCTDGGPERIGQIWRYRPSPYEGHTREGGTPGELTLLVESTDASVLEKCDNITVAPWGDLIVAEDGDGDQFLRGISPEGHVYTIGRNAVIGEDGEASEITGPCFSPDGTTLFFNVQNNPGRTFAVRGPWQERSLALL